jgi:hypothetical protein
MQAHSYSASTMKTPLQPMDMTTTTATPGPTVIRHNLRSLAFETPGLTPIAVNESTAQTPVHHHPSRQNHSSSMLAGDHPHTSNRQNPTVVRRARQVATRQYYPPSPDTTPAVSAVTRSMRYLRGLGTTESNTNTSSSTTTGRSLFQASSSENQTSNTVGHSSNVDFNNCIDNIDNEKYNSQLKNTNDRLNNKNGIMKSKIH